MSEKRFTYTTRIITDKKAYSKDYILDKETLLHTEQIVAILNQQDEYINYVTKERNLACNQLDNVYDELDKALNVLEEIYEDYPKNNVQRLYNNLKGLKERMQ